MFSQTTRTFVRASVAALAIAILTPAVVRADGAGSYTCPVLGSPVAKVTTDTLSTDYHGIRYYFCCASCPAEFKKDPTKFLKEDKNKDKVIGSSLFDPVTTKRIEPERAAAHSDFGVVRYFFASADEKKSFDKEPKKYATAPEKEVLFCPVSKGVVKSYAEAPDYSDYKGTRYYFCCNGCKPQFDKNPDKYLEGLDARDTAAQEKKGDER